MSIDAKRSTSEIRMIAAEVVKQQLKVCGVERARMNDRIAQNTKSIDEMDQAELIANMRATWSEFKGEVRTQIRITWVLLLLILSSLVGVAFSVWGERAVSKLQVWHKVVMVAVSVGALWLVVMSALSLWGNGFFYHIEQPVTVLEVREDAVIVRGTRSALINMPATCARKVRCREQVYLMGEQSCPVNRGTDTWTVALPLPDGVSGECVYRGVVSYRPFGRFGPDQSHSWESEKFTVEERKVK